MYTCVRKIRNNKNIIDAYVIRCEETGQLATVQSNVLRNILKKEPNSVLNLKLTSNNRIVNKCSVIKLEEKDAKRLVAISRSTGFKTDLTFKVQYISNIKNVIQKLNMIGTKYELICNGDAIVIISKDQTTVMSSTKIHLTNNSKFAMAMFKSIDLRNTCPDDITDASDYFYNTTADDIYLNWDNIPYLTNISCLFRQTGTTGKLMRVHGLETINTSNVREFTLTFSGATMNKVDLSKWNLSSVHSINYMFNAATIDNLIIGNHPESISPQYAVAAFEDCHCDKIDLSGVALNKLQYTQHMFRYAVVKQSIDLRTKSGFLTDVPEFSNNIHKHLSDNPFVEVSTSVQLNDSDYAANWFYANKDRKIQICTSV